MKFRRKKIVEPSFVEHTRVQCDLGGCDICLSYWELLDLMLDGRHLEFRQPHLVYSKDMNNTANNTVKSIPVSKVRIGDTVWLGRAET